MVKRPTDAQRKDVFIRAGGLCEYCLSSEDFSNSTFEVEHIFPFSKGGKTVLENLALSCSGCNKFKSHRTEAIDQKTGKTVSLFDPRKDVWKKYFKWSADFTLIIGLTAIGRATVQTLKLNRKSLTNLRKVLYSVDEHPPK